MTLTPAILTKITPSIKGVKAIEIANALNEILPKYGMDNPDIFHEFWANVLEESWEMGKFEESLNYSAERLTVVWPSRFPNITTALPYARNPKKLANKVYGGRMGNVQPNDGWDMRGSGPIQITGRDTMTMLTIYLNKLFGTTFTVYQVAEKLRTDIKLGLHSACWFFSKYKSLNELAMSDNMLAVVKRINGGTTGLHKRLAYYAQVQKFLR